MTVTTTDVAPRAVRTYELARDTFEAKQVGKDTALITLDDLRKLCIAAQRIVVDDLQQQLSEPAQPSLEIVEHHHQLAKCPRCNGRKIVPDFQNWNHDLDDPYPKPCPKCAGGTE